MHRVNDEAAGGLAAHEAQLLHELVFGDDSVAEQFAQTHTPWMTAFAQRLLGNQALAEDCVQEVFLQLLGDTANATKAPSIQSWLSQSVVNQAQTMLGGSQARRLSD